MRPLLWDRTVSKFSKILHHNYFKIHMTKPQTHKRIHPSQLRHKTFLLVLYTTQSFRPVCALACWSSWRRPHTIVSFLKSHFCLHFFLRHHNPFENHTLTRKLAQWKYWFYCGLLVQCISTMNIAKNYLLVYKIVSVAFDCDSKKCCHDHILFLVDGCHSKPVYHLVNITMGRWLRYIVWRWPALVGVCRLVT